MTKNLLRAVLTLAVATPLVASAQDVRVFTMPRGENGRVVLFGGDRMMIGVTARQESERADTLGLYIEDVQRNSPAARAGIKEGDRLQRVNGVSLRADRADAGEEDYDGVLNRRLSREIEKTEAGKTVEIVVLSEGRSRTITVTPVKASELYESAGGYAWSSSSDDRAVIGIGTSASGTPRDTLGVFVSSVTTDGPAEKAGIVEGDRIASINGVNLRVAREDAGDVMVSQARAERLRREIARLDAGGVAELVVITAGRSRTVRVTTVKASELRGSQWETLVMPRMRIPEPPEAAAGVLMPAFPSRAPSPPRAPAAPSAPKVRGRVISL